MGWLFGWSTRKELVEHLINGNGVKTIKSCSVGNNLWCVHEYTNAASEAVRYACLYLIKGGSGRDGWGYKDVDETMGPYKTNFPYTWLDLLSPIESEYANEWRARVKARGERIKSMKLGSKWKANDNTFEIIERRSPTSFRAKDMYGDTYRVKLSQLLRMEAMA